MLQEIVTYFVSRGAGWADIRWLRQLRRRGWDLGGVNYSMARLTFLYLFSLVLFLCMYVYLLGYLGSGLFFDCLFSSSFHVE